MSLREKKAARIKLNIFQATSELLMHTSLRELNVSHICEKAEISRVTFFKYFPRKEDVLVYFLRMWELDREVEQLSSPRRGLEAIYNLFEKATGTIGGKPGVLLSMTAFLANLTAPPPNIPISVAERKILYPENEEIWELTIPTLPEMLIRHIGEAMSDGQLKSSVDPAALAKILISVFHGTPLAALVTEDGNLTQLYKEHLDILFSSSRMVSNEKE